MAKTRLATIVDINSGNTYLVNPNQVSWIIEGTGANGPVASARIGNEGLTVNGTAEDLADLLGFNV